MKRKKRKAPAGKGHGGDPRRGHARARAKNAEKRATRAAHVRPSPKAKKAKKCARVVTTTITRTQRAVTTCKATKAGKASPGARKNPSRRAVPVLGPPRWAPLRTGGRLSERVRAALEGKSGAYAIREKGSRTTLYVGESHSGRTRSHAFHVTGGEKKRRALRTVPIGTRQPERNRMWKTITRHLHSWRPSKRSRAYLEWAKRPDEFVYAGNRDLEVSVWLLPERGNVAELARGAEQQLVLELEPVHNIGQYGEGPEGDTPF